MLLVCHRCCCFFLLLIFVYVYLFLSYYTRIQAYICTYIHKLYTYVQKYVPPLAHFFTRLMSTLFHYDLVSRRALATSRNLPPPKMSLTSPANAAARAAAYAKFFDFIR